MAESIQLTKEGLRYDGKLYPFGDCTKFATRLKTEHIQRISKHFHLPPKLTKNQLCTRLKNMTTGQQTTIASSVAPVSTTDNTITLTKNGLMYHGTLYSLDNCAQFAKAKITKKDLAIVCEKLGCNPKLTKEKICQALREKLEKSSSAPPPHQQQQKAQQQAQQITVTNGQFTFKKKTYIVASLNKEKVVDLRLIATALEIPHRGVLKAVLVKNITSRLKSSTPSSPVHTSQKQLVYDAVSDSVKIGTHRFFFGKCNVARTYAKKDVLEMARHVGVTVKPKDTVKIVCERIQEKVKHLKPTAPTPKAPTPKAPTPKAPTPKAPLQKMTDDEIREAIKKCLHLS
jgi:hypothetical protein